MRRISTLVLALMLASLITAASSQAKPVRLIPQRCGPKPATTLCAIHGHHRAANRYRARLGLSPLTYHWGAEARPSRRGYILHRWYMIHRHWRSAYRHRPQWSVPGWFVTDMRCISAHEEYGMTGPNTSAGYFGFVYPPASYIQPGPSLAAEYGNAWPDVPLQGQLSVAYALEQHYGWSPWSTASACGLG